ncbi:MAG: porin [Tannerellaceae bacterium]|jgi:hypothetical protein|nr:porin [Tannerellaceae bacterium]
MKKQWKNKSSIGRIVCILYLSLLFLNGAAGIRAQETREFIPSGSPIIVLFADYTAGASNNNEVAGFNLTRSRLGYRYQATPSLSAVSVLDVNVADDGQRGVHFHYAFFEWTWRNLRVNGGLIALSQFAVQEAFWGRRYIEKSFQDLNGFCFDSDLGVMLKYRFVDWLEVDVTLINGEGTRQLNLSKTNRYGLGATFRPLKGLSLRAYLDVYERLQSGYLAAAPGAPSFTRKNQSSASLFAGYRNASFSLGAEYNRQQAKDFIGGNNYSGISIYGGAALDKKFDIYARFDYIDTQTPSEYDYDWSAVAGEALFIAGVEYHPVGNLQISPNYRYMQAFGGEGSHFIGLNIGFSL